MAVKSTPDPLMMRDYLVRYRRRSIVMITASTALAALTIGFIVAASGALSLVSLWFWVAIFFVFLLLTSIGIGLFYVLNAPFADLIRAVVVVSGERTILTPPNPNSSTYDRDGFREILQTVYELASKESAPQAPEPVADTALIDGINNASVGVVILDANRKVIYSNKKAPVRINTDGDGFIDLIFPKDDSLDTWLEACEKKAVRAEHQWLRVANRDPGERGRKIFDVSASYQKDSSAETVFTFFDRTASYAPEEDDLDFISFAAHELRGPITVIRGYLDVLDDELKPVLKDDQQELIDRLTVSANRLSSYVSNILNASRYDRRHFRLHISEESLATIYDVIRDDMELRASAQNRLLSIDFPQDLPTVAADRNSIGEVLGNLVDNAIKYSNEGGLVQVVARPVRDHVEVSVIDRGIGMPANVIQNLFHKFYRSHRSRETVAGTGIGLYISKTIVESHGGTITARSAEREGSTFTFTLPIYGAVADKVKAGHNSNEKLISDKTPDTNWIQNHSMYRG